MLRIHASVNSHAAAEYLSGLTKDDYYSKSEITGRWHGEAARMLGLQGEVTPEQFLALVNNKDPRTGQRLTLRQRANRRAGYDFTFNAPKSLSIAYALTGDQALLDAWRESVQETMAEIQKEVKARVRKGGQQTDRTTGNFLWGEFVHLTARPEGGHPDPHMHSHCYVINATHDSAEQAWKAIEIGGILRDAPYWESLAHSKVADRLARAGHTIERTRHGWELSAVPARLRDVFSSRTRAIEKIAREKGITDPEKKGAIGARSRQKKVDLSPAELTADWESRLLPQEREALSRLGPDARVRQRVRQGSQPQREQAAQAAVENSLAHSLERNSVVGERQMLRHALKHGVGKTGLDEIRRATAGRGDVITRDYQGQRLLTTNEVLLEEQRMVEFARQTRGTCAPYAGPKAPEATRASLADPELSAEQRAAVDHILMSKDQVMMVKGRAGVGKTRSLKLAADAIQAAGHRVVAVAPSAEASRKNLRESGFGQAETVARLLQSEKMQSEIKPRDLILVDEAGQVSTKDMQALFAVAQRTQARVLLVGDTRQHGPVARGNAQKILEQQSGIVPAEIKAIRRQQGTYREAVEALAEGNTRTAFEKLEELEAIRQIEHEGARYAAAAKDYAELTGKGQNVLVVSPTHYAADRCSEQIRLELRNQRRLGPSEHVYTRLQSLGMTEGMKADPINYCEGDIVCFRQRAPGFAIGHRARVLGTDEQGRVLVQDSAGRPATLPLERAKSFDVHESSPISLAPGDKIRFLQNGRTKDDHRVNNGSVYGIKGFEANGDIRLENGWVVDRDYGHFKHGYVTTSYSSQSRTVDAVLIVQGRESAAAASQAQAYVSVSRGRNAEALRIYTDDKQALEAAMRRPDSRISATELVGEQMRQQRRVRQKRQAVREQVQPTTERQANRQPQQQRIPGRDRA